MAPRTRALAPLSSSVAGPSGPRGCVFAASLEGWPLPAPSRRLRRCHYAHSRHVCWRRGAGNTHSRDIVSFYPVMSPFKGRGSDSLKVTPNFISRNSSRGRGDLTARSSLKAGGSPSGGERPSCALSETQGSRARPGQVEAGPRGSTCATGRASPPRVAHAARRGPGAVRAARHVGTGASEPRRVCSGAPEPPVTSV